MMVIPELKPFHKIKINGETFYIRAVHIGMEPDSDIGAMVEPVMVVRKLELELITPGELQTLKESLEGLG